MIKTTKHSNELLTHLGDAIRNRRVDIGMTQQELAMKSELHRTYITDVEGGNRNISMLTYNKLTDALLCAVSLPLLEAERSMGLQVTSNIYGTRGGLSKTSRLLHSSSSFYIGLKVVVLELLVKANMSMVQEAVENFQRKLSHYPRDKSELDVTLHGHLPVNPFTKKAVLPSIGEAESEDLATRLTCSLHPGELEYSPINKGGNYIIRAGGAGGTGLTGRSPDSIYVLSGNLRSNNQP